MTRFPLSGSFRQCRLLLVGFLALSACTDRTPAGPSPSGAAFARPTGGNGPTVKAAVPDSASVDTTLNVRVLGSGFDQGSRANWAFKGVPSAKVVTNSTQFVSSTELVANITIAPDANIGSYDVIVTTSAGKGGIGTELFAVTMKTTDLGTLAGTTSRAFVINNSGDVAGESATPDGSMRATYWTRVSLNKWAIRQLAPAQNEFQSGVGDISDAGVIVGWTYYRASDGSTQQDPIRWMSSNAVAENLGTAGTVAGGVNFAGQIVGGMKVSGVGHAVVWNNGAATDLGGFGGGESEATSINSAGVTAGVGRATPQGMNRGVVWRSGVITALPMLPGGTSHAFAHDINDEGVIVGSSPISSGEWHAVRWVPAANEPSGYRVEDLGFPSSIARAINNDGVIVGHYHLRGGSERAFYWHPTRGKMDLPALSGKATTLAFGINDAGEVVGFGNLTSGSSVVHAIVWTGIQ